VAAVGRPPRLLVLRALGLGDLLTAAPALRALADAFPGHRRLLACPRELAGLAELTGAVDEVVDARPLEPLPTSLHGVDVAVNLHGRGPQSHLLLGRLEPKRLIAFANGAARFFEGPRWRPGEHERVRWCRLLEESSVPADPSRLDLPAPPIRVPARLRGLTIVHPGAAAPARRWPAARFAAVARAEGAAGRRVAITGARSEAALAREVARLAGLPGAAVLAGRTGVRELAALVDTAERVVCGDTGMAHLATAMRTPSVLLFGPVSPGLWGPPADRPWHRVLWAGGLGDPHGGDPDGGLLEIAVDDVLAALADLPAASPAPPLEPSRG
jgi:ADP-heptose:LPS heptosyltransferase